MTRHDLLAAFVLACVCLLAPPAAHGAESYDNCTGFITSVPATISTQGTWCMKQDLATSIGSSSAITINANNVTLDCNNFKLGGLAAGVGTTANGVYLLNRSNATIRRCNIRGFFRAVFLNADTGSSGGGHVVEDSRFDGNTFGGVVVYGDGSVVRRNRILDTGGSTVQAAAYGLYLAFNVDVLDNTIANVNARNGGNGWATGISNYSSFRTRINGNTVRGVVADGTGVSVGITSQSEDYMVIRGNDLVGNASAGSKGIACSSANNSARDNVISGFATALLFCANSGGNDVVP